MSTKTPAHAPGRLSYRVEETAALLGVSSRFVWKLLSTGELKARRVGRVTLVPAAELARLLGEKGAAR
jgi:excisionase family DNA binding protein